jgi:kinesin family protein C1
MAVAPVTHTFGFDKVFGPATTQEQVFSEISELVQSALDGHKVGAPDQGRRCLPALLHALPVMSSSRPTPPPLQVCIFAYGQTGSGKTHTMMGTPEQQGVIPLAMQQVFDTSRQLATQGWTFSMQASMLEIYNEEYKDLLAKKRLPEGKSHKVGIAKGCLAGCLGG